MTDTNPGGLFSKLYRVFIAPKQKAQDLRNREVVCNVVLAGTTLFVAVIFLLLLVSYFVLHHNYAADRLISCGIAFAYLGGVLALSRRKHHYVASYLIIAFYGILAATTIWQWGINTPFGILVFGLVIVLAGILLTARHALYGALLGTGTLAITHLADIQDWHHPDTSWTRVDTNFGDVIAYSAGFAFMALISWLYGREMERSLYRAWQAESDLLKEKAMLEVRVKERTLELRKTQLEEMQQMYRFAELGQLSTALLHDLANHLSVLTLEIDGLKQSKQHASAITRSKDIIHYMDNMVDDVRDQLRGNVQNRTFNVVQKISETVELLRYKAAGSNVALDWQMPEDKKQFAYTGDPVRLSQVVAIVIGNAIDAYEGSTSKRADYSRRVVIRVVTTHNQIRIHIQDWGRGIPKSERKHLFKPFQTTKKTGMGIGLFIAKQTIEAHFAGNITLTDADNSTEFIITLTTS